ncbi:hypothetical protein HK103_003001 [Boothiomyces macroporosus]|uniref:Uncharacterized protein n=1 Tax=Boothiomyces macroporosus TaxID=261099 RepID=A0AAD5ULH0_9FUNG|nr:hypothetical protein HK103_003001 [Boothiomyces macroporosus]
MKQKRRKLESDDDEETEIVIPQKQKRKAGMSLDALTEKPKLKEETIIGQLIQHDEIKHKLLKEEKKISMELFDLGVLSKLKNIESTEQAKSKLFMNEKKKLEKEKLNVEIKQRSRDELVLELFKKRSWK